ncbi:MAG: HAMP domain-containing sensor histidine kinase, partial [Streptosporangiaceae bacterium]
MAQARQRAGFWRSVRDLPGRTPLRVKLITALLALVAMALVVISVAGLAILRNDLIGPIDDELTGSFGNAVSAVAQYQQTGIGGAKPDVALYWIAGNGVIHDVITPTAEYSGAVSGHNPFGDAQPIPGPDLQSSASWISAHSGRVITLSDKSGSYHWRVYMASGPLANGTTATVVLAINATSEYTTIGQLETIDLLVSLAVIGLLAILAIAVIRASLRPLTDIEQTASAIAAGDLSQRVPERDPRTEVGRLGRSLNTMLSQIESAFHARSQSEAAAKRNEERMRQFVGDASHELRTPLTAIRGFAEYYRQRGGVALGAGTSPAAGRIIEGNVAAGSAAAGAGAISPASPGQLAPADMDRIMRRVEQEAARMGILVEDMLLLARLDQQRPLEARPVDLLTLAADAVHDARVVAPSRSINLTVDSGRALLVIGDEVRLRQVIGNLMSNALTHTPDGTPIDVLIRSGNPDEAPAATAMAQPPQAAIESGTQADDNGDEPTVTASTASFDAGHPPPPPAAPLSQPDAPLSQPDALLSQPEAPLSEPAAALSHPAAPLSQPAAVLEVTDHGPGLTQDQAEHVFERFYRADAARTTGGTGLGLAIVAALVAAHGGATWVRSQPGAGATFCIALPLSPDALQVTEDDADDDADALPADLTGGASDGSNETGAAAWASA